MPHQCVRCNKFYDDGAKEILNGCSCGARLFFFVKKERLEELKSTVSNLSKKDKKQIEDDVTELVGVASPEEPIVLDLESIRIIKPGHYELDLVNLFRKRPLIYKLEEGKYVIDLPETFQSKDLKKE